MNDISDKDLQFMIIGVHRSSREVVVWAGKEGFMPITRDRQATPLMSGARIRAKCVSGEVAEMLMKRITAGGPSRNYEFVLVPVVPATTDAELARGEQKLILPHFH